MNFFKRAPEAQAHDSPANGDSTVDRLDSEKGSSTGAAKYDAALERRVVKKLDRNVMPIVFALYLLSFLDRSNIGNARIAGMEDDLDLGTGGRYAWLLTIFYISYIVFEPLVLMFKLLPPHIWVTFVVFVWGLASTCLAAANSWASAMVLRFIMGASEAGYGPGIVFYLSFFYLRHEVGLRQGLFLSAAPLASTFAGALAYGITSGHTHLAPWRLLFIVEGLPTICVAPVAFFFLPDSPVKARFLSEEEKAGARARNVRQAGTDKSRVGGIDWKDTFRTLLDAKAWFTALMYFSCNTSFASLPVFLPTILEAMGYEKIRAQGLSAPPYFAAFIVTILSVWIADKTQQRAFMIMGLSLMGSVGYVILATATNSVGARYFATFLVASGVFPSIANILPWVSNNQGSDSRRGAAYVMLNVVGQCGPILGTNIYPDRDRPDFVKGHSVCAAFLFFTTCLAAGLRLLLRWENKKLDQKYGDLKEQKAELEQRAGEVGKEIAPGQENYGPLYRYVL